MSTPIEKAIGIAGSQTSLARLLKVAPQAVQQWATRGRVPAERVLAVEKATGVSRHDLRPDLYPAEEAA